MTQCKALLESESIQKWHRIQNKNESKNKNKNRNRNENENKIKNENKSGYELHKESVKIVTNDEKRTNI